MRDTELISVMKLQLLLHEYWISKYKLLHKHAIWFLDTFYIGKKTNFPFKKQNQDLYLESVELVLLNKKETHTLIEQTKTNPRGKL